ncbi:hypothetical protein B0H13DRAFT_1664782 [Mycena leptocephala]|nr:hypothetical protein B0H13DRAFT_1664782 [Mycena leptocephala]
MFRLATGRKKNSGKKQSMACIFCRGRKIGCLRPPEDEPDQTCKQCARRERGCEYPTESRRGQHNCTRFAATKSFSVDESFGTASGSSRPTTADDGVGAQGFNYIMGGV